MRATALLALLLLTSSTTRAGANPDLTSLRPARPVALTLRTALPSPDAGAVHSEARVVPGAGLGLIRSEGHDVQLHRLDARHLWTWRGDGAERPLPHPTRAT